MEYESSLAENIEVFSNEKNKTPYQGVDFHKIIEGCFIHVRNSHGILWHNVSLAERLRKNCY